MKDMKELWIRFRLKYLPSKISNQEFCDYMRSKGIAIGKGTYFFEPATVEIDTQRPWMISIGEYCKITKGVIILQHDYSRAVLRRVYGEVIAESKETKIGDNVFIGMNSIILMGAQIGDNSIIGAGSIVSGHIPANSVAAGNPARVICTLDEFYKKRKSAYICEAKETANKFKTVYGVYPTAKQMGAFFPLYGERCEEWLKNNNIRTNLSGDEEKRILEFYYDSEAQFASYQEFLNSISMGGGRI